MGLNTRNADVERLAAEVAGLARESTTAATRNALLERRARLQPSEDRSVGPRNIRDYMERNIWPLVPPAELGRVLSK
ncbi:type II toxin-antitoxin system VapB family antitoxin [Paludibaculum fermentans]|uniref:Type II toxin-antitoxin system VapB family antitoxin n=1 Tax=Paludibaculum fermentans TaxID=1473598 RepID=A0A7S7NWL1_PALFE|nr:type II toxin-antitoxin system VapB family antitoxin [Paludibaculum fermentans]QOY91143.1 type II toxin-antitoxin system VapB family antitoxin [Paludibaculum fermentans]